MSKRERHQQILDVLRAHRVGSQEALRALLQERGTEVTQATLSRDMRELRLVKVPGADGSGYYTSPEEWDSTPSLDSLLPALFHSAEGVDHLLIKETVSTALRLTLCRRQVDP